MVKSPLMAGGNLLAASLRWVFNCGSNFAEQPGPARGGGTGAVAKTYFVVSAFRPAHFRASLRPGFTGNGGRLLCRWIGHILHLGTLARRASEGIGCTPSLALWASVLLGRVQ